MDRGDDLSTRADVEADPPAGRKFTFPSALTILVVVTLGVWALAFLVPPGVYDRNEEGAPVQGTYHRVDSDQSFVDRLNDLFLSPVNGLYGVQDAETGVVGPDLAGELYGSAGVFLFVLAIGAFITVVFATGALDRGIGRLAHRLRDRGALLIAGVMLVFSLLGTVEGFAEETLGFYGLIIPLMLALGYDRMVATGTIILGAGIGVLCSTVNPFATGVASSAADISLGDGIVLRAVMWVVLTAVTIAYVIRYANRVRRNPERSLSGFLPGDREHNAAESEEPPELTRLHQVVLVLVALVFAFMIFSVVPWPGPSRATPTPPRTASNWAGPSRNWPRSSWSPRSWWASSPASASRSSVRRRTVSGTRTTSSPRSGRRRRPGWSSPPAAPEAVGFRTRRTARSRR